jgi:DNA-directed RNA polymerase specialized sigma24 family protein
VLGPELTATFLITFGGAELYLSADPRGRSALQALAGYDKAKALAAHPAMQMVQRIPLARKWLVQMMAWQGLPHAEIARRARVATSTVRRYVNEAAE